MPRKPRNAYVGGLFHVGTRGNNKQDVYLGGADRYWFLEMFGKVVVRYAWDIYAYCLMTNHYHLVLVTPEPNISQGMHHLNGVYARWFNHRHGYAGHLFQRRFHSAVIESDWHLLEACRYVVLNPVRAGIVSGPSDWEWSSYRATVGASGSGSTLAVDELLKFFGRRRNTAREAFRAFVADAPSRR